MIAQSGWDMKVNSVLTKLQGGSKKKGIGILQARAWVMLDNHRCSFGSSNALTRRRLISKSWTAASNAEESKACQKDHENGWKNSFKPGGCRSGWRPRWHRFWLQSPDKHAHKFLRRLHTIVFDNYYMIGFLGFPCAVD